MTLCTLHTICTFDVTIHQYRYAHEQCSHCNLLKNLSLTFRTDNKHITLFPGRKSTFYMESYYIDVKIQL